MNEPHDDDDNQTAVEALWVTNLSKKRKSGADVAQPRHIESPVTPLDDTTFARLVDALMKTIDDKPAAESNCWKSRNALNGRGHMQLKFENVKYLGHRVAAMQHKTGKWTVTTDEASHLCGVRDCVRPSHLWLESSTINRTRDCCHLYLGVHPQYVCPHSPKCIEKSQ